MVFMNATLGQIGEPRLDSGFIPAVEVRPKFNPLTPLLPEELCWIIDRAFSYEACAFKFLLLPPG
jgi:hypothetical protein